MTRALFDSHLHSWERARNPQPWIEPDTMPAIDRDFSLGDAEAVLAGCGVGGAIVVQAVNSTQETLDLLAAATAPIWGVVGWVDLTGDVRDQIAVLRSAEVGSPLVGVRHLAHLETDPAWLVRPDVSAGIGALGDADLPVDVVVRAHQLPVVARLADEHPGARFVLDHLGKPPILAGGAELDRWADDLADLARRPNVVAKVSGLTIEDDWNAWRVDRLARVVDLALAAFGPDRLMFGSDWPLVNLTGGYAAWRDAYLELTAGLSPDEQAAVDQATARGLYGVRHE